jgi:hypothetical protein
MQHISPKRETVNRKSTANPRDDLGDWEHVGIPLARVLSQCAKAYIERSERENGGKK